MYKFGNRSLSSLATVHEVLQDIASVALTHSEYDFMVVEGARSKDRQQELIAQGASFVSNSKHIPVEPHGKARAIDVAAFVNGAVSWDAKYYDAIAEAFAIASREFLPIRWGGSWQPLVPSLYYTPTQQREAYIAGKKAQGRKPFLDLGHFELLLEPL